MAPSNYQLIFVKAFRVPADGSSTMENNRTLDPRSAQLVGKFGKSQKEEVQPVGERKGCCQACWRRALASSPSKSLNRLHISTPGEPSCISNQIIKPAERAHEEICRGAREVLRVRREENG